MVYHILDHKNVEEPDLDWSWVALKFMCAIFIKSYFTIQDIIAVTDAVNFNCLSSAIIFFMIMFNLLIDNEIQHMQHTGP